jgi:hypothetical protein
MFKRGNTQAAKIAPAQLIELTAEDVTTSLKKEKIIDVVYGAGGTEGQFVAHFENGLNVHWAGVDGEFTAHRYTGRSHIAKYNPRKLNEDDALTFMEKNMIFNRKLKEFEGLQRTVAAKEKASNWSPRKPASGGKAVRNIFAVAVLSAACGGAAGWFAARHTQPDATLSQPAANTALTR